MKNKSEDLKNILFEQLDRLSDTDLDLEVEIKRSKAMTDVGQTIINLAKEEIAFNKMKFQLGEELQGNFFKTKELQELPNEKEEKLQKALSHNFDK